ncbi:MAG TPA: choice-of-anchor tandem repeat GloVer-containing protein [Candidatus Sulfotelmatobacter sp.]|nr:choice-of-anchor tandem repeat GloVer-containing protein [Candidatus Sulfotelmatobacter sp.]
MPARTLDVRKSNWNRAQRLALACALLMVFAAASLHAQAYQDLYDLGCIGGCSPIDSGRLTQGVDGNLYGTTEFGGTNNDGALFFATPSGSSAPLFYFDGAKSGANPVGALTLASTDGNFYGTTSNGGKFGFGTLFRFNASTLKLNVLHHFSSTEGSPLVAPIEAKDKRLYGTTVAGTLYRVTLPNGPFTILPNTVPQEPLGPLFQASDGFLYGTTELGGTNNLGTIFRMATNGTIKIIHNFTGLDGSNPAGPLVQGKDGNLYGTTQHGGAATDDTGTVFKLTLPSLVFSTLFSFDPFNLDATNVAGAFPFAGLLQGPDGNFYGSATNGGANTAGTLFQITPGGVFTKLFDLDSAVANGALPETTLMEHTNGVFYGLTSGGGSFASGEFYSLTLPKVNVNITLCCNWWVILDQPVTILGQGLRGAVAVNFGSVAAQFQPGSDTFLTAFVPSGAIDAPVSVTLATGAQIETEQNAHILPTITNLDPSSGSVGSQVNIVGGGFAATKKVTFGGVAATTFSVLTPGLIQATVPAGAVTGKVGVATPNGSALSPQTFTVN